MNWLCSLRLGDVVCAGVLSGLVVVVLLELGCFSRPPLSEGTVTGKHYRAAYTETTFIYVGKVMVPFPQSYPDSWWIDVVDDNLRSERVVVSEEAFNAYSVGDHWKR